MAFVLPDINTENRLLRLARQGNQAAVSEIYEKYFPSVYQFIRLRVDNTQTAEDIASEVFFTLLDNIGGSSGPHQSLRGWLFRVARNEIYQHYGKNRQMPTTALDEWVPTADDVEIDFIRSVEGKRIRQVMRMLAPEQQEVLILRFSEGLSLEETADVMGKSVSAIKSLQFRATDTLRRILAESREIRHGD
jgi:RNA polymerase sigma-70 factor, ECF subfamily